MHVETSAQAVSVRDQRTKYGRKLKTVESDFKPLIVVFDVGPPTRFSRQVWTNFTLNVMFIANRVYSLLFFDILYYEKLVSKIDK